MAPSGNSIPHRHNAEAAYSSVKAEEERRTALHHHSSQYHQSSSASSIHATAAAVGALDHQIEASGHTKSSFEVQTPNSVDAEAAGRNQYPSFLTTASVASAAGTAPTGATVSAATAMTPSSSSSSSAATAISAAAAHSSHSSTSAGSMGVHSTGTTVSESRCMQLGLGGNSRVHAGDIRDPRSSSGCVMNLEGCDGACAHACSSSQATKAPTSVGVDVGKGHAVSCLNEASYATVGSTVMTTSPLDGESVASPSQTPSASPLSFSSYSMGSPSGDRRPNKQMRFSQSATSTPTSSESAGGCKVDKIQHSSSSGYESPNAVLHRRFFSRAKRQAEVSRQGRLAHRHAAAAVISSHAIASGRRLLLRHMSRSLGEEELSPLSTLSEQRRSSMGDEVKVNESAPTGFHLQPVPASKRRKANSPSREHDDYRGKRYRLEPNLSLVGSSPLPQRETAKSATDDVQRHRDAKVLTESTKTAIYGSSSTADAACAAAALSKAAVSPSKLPKCDPDGRSEACTPRDASRLLDSDDTSAAPVARRAMASASRRSGEANTTEPVASFVPVAFDPCQSTSSNLQLIAGSLTSSITMSDQERAGLHAKQQECHAAPLRPRQAIITRPADVVAPTSRRRMTRLRRTLSLPNLKAKPVLDLCQPATHRLSLPPKLAQFLASLRNHAQHQAAEEAAAAAAAERSGREIVHRPSTFFTPPLHPPITRHTLRELDLGEILKNPQLRHDVVFDVNVQFRPNFDGERGRRKKEAGNKYWVAVMREIEKSCTCTTFNGRTLLPCTCSAKTPGHVLTHQHQHHKQSQVPREGTSRGRQPHTPSSASFGSSRSGLGRSIPSRIPMLIQELRAICLSILPSGSSTDPGPSCHPPSPGVTAGSATVPPQSPSSPAETQADEKRAQSTSKTGNSSNDGEGQRLPQQQPSQRATTKHAISNITSLRSVTSGGPSWAASHHLLIAQTLDPHLITQQLQHGVLDVAGLVTFMGTILKMHCAPMRDDIIEKMVQVVCVEGDVAKGLRMCFEILELMKLDIANHQLRSSRLYLVETAIEFETRWFREQIEQGKVTLDRTTSWFAEAHRQRVAATPSSQAMSKSDLISRAFDDGFLKLIFDPPAALQPLAALASSVNNNGQPTNASASQIGSTAVTLSSSSLNYAFITFYPETFQFDAYRLMTFHGDVTDLTVVYMLLLLFRQLACSPFALGQNPLPDTTLSQSAITANASNIASRQLELVKTEIWCLLNDANLSATATSSPGSSPPTTPAPRTPTTPGMAGRLLAAVATGSSSGPNGAAAGAKIDNAKWKRAMRDVVLQIAARASAIQWQARCPNRYSPADDASTPALPIEAGPPSDKTLELLNSWLDTNLRNGSALHKLCQNRLRDILRALLVDRLKVTTASFLPPAQSATLGSSLRVRKPVTTGASASTSRTTAASSMAPPPSPLGATMATSVVRKQPDDASERVDRTDESKRLKMQDGTSAAVAAAMSKPSKSLLPTSASSLSSPSSFSSSRPTVPLKISGLPMSSMTPTPSSSSIAAVEHDWETALQRAGLEPFAAEVKLLGDRAAKVAAFHLRIFRPLYERIAADAISSQQSQR